jgi:hypothetical protein
MHVQWATFFGLEACLLAVQLRNADHTRYRGNNFGANSLNVRHSTKVFLLLELLLHCCPCWVQSHSRAASYGVDLQHEYGYPQICLLYK